MKNIFTIICFALGLSQSYAETIYFKGTTASAGGCEWSYKGNWLTTKTPTSGDDVVFDGTQTGVTSSSAYAFLPSGTTSVNSIKFNNNFFAGGAFSFAQTKDSELNVKKDFTITNGINITARGTENGSMGGTLVIGGDFNFINEGENASYEAVIGGNNSASVAKNYWSGGPLTKMLISGNMNLNGNYNKPLQLHLNIGEGKIGKTVNLEDPDIEVKGLIKLGTNYGRRVYLTLGGSGTRTGIGSTQVIACGGLSGFGMIRGGMANATDAINGSYSLAVLSFNNAIDGSYEIFGGGMIIADSTVNNTFNNTCKIALAMNGEGTQSIQTESIKFSGGVTVNKGNLILAGIAGGSNDSTYSHGNLVMNGGKLTINTTNTSTFTSITGGNFKFADIIWESGSIALGFYDDKTFDTLSCDGKFFLEEGNDNILMDLMTDDCSMLRTETKLIAWTGYDENITKSMFITGNKTDILTGENCEAVYRLANDGLYVQYVAVVPEPSFYASFIGIISLVIAFRRRTR